MNNKNEQNTEQFQKINIQALHFKPEEKKYKPVVIQKYIQGESTKEKHVVWPV